MIKSSSMAICFLLILLNPVIGLLAIQELDGENETDKNFFLSPFSSCPGTNSGVMPKSVRIYGCSNSGQDGICTMSRNSTKERVPRFEVDFVAPFDARSLWTDVRARLVTENGQQQVTRPPISTSWFSRPSLPSSSSVVSNLLVPIPSSVIERDACDKHGISCPLLTGQKYTYYHDFDVDTASTTSWSSPIVNRLNSLLVSRDGIARMEIVWKFTDYWGFPLNCFKLQVLIV